MRILAKENDVAAVGARPPPLAKVLSSGPRLLSRDAGSLLSFCLAHPPIAHSTRVLHASRAAVDVILMLRFMVGSLVAARAVGGSRAIHRRGRGAVTAALGLLLGDVIRHQSVVGEQRAVARERAAADQRV